MNIKEFDRTIKEQDFSIGDTFWLNGVEFEVTGKRATGICIDCGKDEINCVCNSEEWTPESFAEEHNFKEGEENE